MVANKLADYAVSRLKEVLTPDQAVRFTRGTFPIIKRVALTRYTYLKLLAYETVHLIHGDKLNGREPKVVTFTIQYCRMCPKSMGFIREGEFRIPAEERSCGTCIHEPMVRCITPFPNANTVAIIHWDIIWDMLNRLFESVTLNMFNIWSTVNVGVVGMPMYTESKEAVINAIAELSQIHIPSELFHFVNLEENPAKRDLDCIVVRGKSPENFRLIEVNKLQFTDNLNSTFLNKVGDKYDFENPWDNVFWVLIDK